MHALVTLYGTIHSYWQIVLLQNGKGTAPTLIEARCNRILFKKTLNTLRDQEF
jgi:hypothetical protein